MRACANAALVPTLFPFLKSGQNPWTLDFQGHLKIPEVGVIKYNGLTRLTGLSPRTTRWGIGRASIMDGFCVQFQSQSGNDFEDSVESRAPFSR